MAVATTTIYDLVCSALRNAGVKAMGEIPTEEEQDVSLESMNVMLGAWSSRQELARIVVRETFTTTASKSSYTISSGAGNDINTERPIKLMEGSHIVETNISYPLTKITREDYDLIAQKTLENRPFQIFYDDSFPTGTIFLYNTPGKVYTVHLRSRKKLTQFSSVIDDVTLPDEYKELIKYGLAVRLAPEFGRRAPPEVIGLFQDALAKVNILREHDPPVLDNSDLSFAGGTTQKFGIRNIDGV